MPINTKTTSRVMIQIPTPLKNKIKAEADKRKWSVPLLIKTVLEEKFK